MRASGKWAIVLGRWTGRGVFLQALAARARRLTRAGVPITFYGKVADQDGRPVPGAHIRAVCLSPRLPRLEETARAPHALSAGDAIEVEAWSGEDGAFQFAGITGSALAIESVDKEGFAWSRHDEHVFCYRPGTSMVVHSPDMQSPVTYHLWRRGKPAELVCFDLRTRIACDGTAATFDLLKGCPVTSGGDLRVSLSRKSGPIEGRETGCAWEIAIASVDGGVMAAADQFAPFAPEEGYQPAMTLRVAPDDPGWTPDKSVGLYLKSRGGACYGHVVVRLRLGSDGPTTGCSILSFINPAGERNLEPTPGRRPTAVSATVHEMHHADSP